MFKVLHEVFREDIVVVKPRSVQNLGESFYLGLISINSRGYFTDVSLVLWMTAWAGKFGCSAQKEHCWVPAQLLPVL